MIGRSKRRSRGASVLEFTLVGIPMIFVLISTIEMARGMWLYHTLAYAVKAGTRYSVVHGQNCSLSPNSCTVTIGQIATVIQTAGVGLPTDTTTLTFTTASNSATSCTISACIANYTTNMWPPASDNVPGNIVKISGVYPFQSAISVFWPGAGRVTAGAPATVNLSADSAEAIQF